MARNLASHIPSAREWHLVTTAYLRQSGVNTPVYRTDSWEVDWSKRRGKLVRARNPRSEQPKAREWHFVQHKTLKAAGVKWRPKAEPRGRFISGDGYVMLTPRGMTEEQVRLADEHGLWRGKKRSAVAEHRLVAVETFGAIPDGHFVRHLNGTKTDNRPGNLVLGTPKENAWDHETARRMAMYWRNRYEEAEREIERLRALL